jgi:hypothetical protein
MDWMVGIVREVKWARNNNKNKRKEKTTKNKKKKNNEKTNKKKIQRKRKERKPSKKEMTKESSWLFIEKIIFLTFSQMLEWFERETRRDVTNPTLCDWKSDWMIDVWASSPELIVTNRNNRNECWLRHIWTIVKSHWTFGIVWQWSQKDWKMCATCHTQFGKKMYILGENPGNDQRVSFSRIELLMISQFIWFGRSPWWRNCGTNEWQWFDECHIWRMIAVVMITNSWILIWIERLNERRKRRWKKEEKPKDEDGKQWSKQVIASKT